MFGCRVYCTVLPITRCKHCLSAFCVKMRCLQTPPLLGSYFNDALEIPFCNTRCQQIKCASSLNQRSQAVANTMYFIIWQRRKHTHTVRREMKSINFNDNAETKDFRIIKLHVIRNLVSLSHRHNDNDDNGIHILTALISFAQ